MIRFLPLLLGALLVLTAGCKALRPGPAQTTTLPEYPKVATTMVPGQSATYRDATIALVDIVREEDQHNVLFTITRGRETSHFNVAFDELTVSGDILLRFQPRPGAAPEDDIAVATLYSLPHLMRQHHPRTRRQLTESRPGEIAFFQDGFVAINSIHENDYVATDDDSVQLTIWTPGDSQEDINLREFSTFPIGQTILKVGNVLPGDTPAQGRVELTLVPRAEAWEDTTRREELTIPYRGTVQWRGHELRAESLPGGWRSRILLTVQHEDTSHDVVLTEGQSWRRGAAAWRLDNVTAGSANLTAFEFEDAVYPLDLREGAPAPQREQNPRAPTRIERTLIQDQSLEFWGARIRLNRVIQTDPTSLFDDVAEFVFDVAGRLETVRVREGDRATVRGENRWYVVEVTAATPTAPNRSGRAEFILTTGTFFNP